MGVYLTLRHTSQGTRVHRAEQHRVEQREAIIELFDAGNQWAGSVEGVIMALGAVSELTEIAELETFKQHTPKNVRYRHALARARLTVTEPRLAQIVEALYKHVDELQKYTPALLKDRRNGKATPEALGKALGYADAHSAALENLATETKILLSPEHRQPRGMLTRIGHTVNGWVAATRRRVSEVRHSQLPQEDVARSSDAPPGEPG